MQHTSPKLTKAPTRGGCVPSLPKLSRERYEALQKSSYLKISAEETGSYDKRRLRIREICRLWAGPFEVIRYSFQTNWVKGVPFPNWSSGSWSCRITFNRDL